MEHVESRKVVVYAQKVVGNLEQVVEEVEQRALESLVVCSMAQKQHVDEQVAVEFGTNYLIGTRLPSENGCFSY